MIIGSEVLYGPVEYLPRSNPVRVENSRRCQVRRGKLKFFASKRIKLNICMQFLVSKICSALVIISMIDTRS